MGVLATGITGAGVAIALPANDESDRWPVIVATPSAAEPTTPAERLQRPQSEALRRAVIARVSLLRQSRSAEDSVPSEYLPATGNGSPIILTEKDLTFARKVPGTDASWVVPMPTGSVLLVERHGGAEFAPEQLDTGGVVSSNPDDTGATVVTGIVPDGTESVSIETASGDSTSVPVRNSAYSKTFAKWQRPKAVSFTAKTKGRVVAALAG